MATLNLAGGITITWKSYIGWAMRFLEAFVVFVMAFVTEME